jgi:SAM-dependent methyltransferase
VATVSEFSGVEAGVGSNGSHRCPSDQPLSPDDDSHGLSPGVSNPRNPIARRDRFIRDLIAELPSDSLVVSVGCGMMRQFESAGSRYLATDLRVLPNVDFASDAGRLPLVDDSADLVVALELLEHVPKPQAILRELSRVLKPGGTAVVSVPSTVPRHDVNDYWRFTAQGLERLGTEVFEKGEVHVFGGTFEALGYLAEYYTALTLHVLHLPSRRLRQVFTSVGYWLDRHNRWSTSQTALHTLAFDLLFVGHTATGD